MTHLTRRGSTAVATTLLTAACAIALVAPATAALSATGSDGRELATLKGTVGPGFTISISDEEVPAGKYKIVVNDKGTQHNFHITGDGVDKSTTVPFTGKKTFKVKLKPGTYEIQCDPHAATMNVTLTVT